MLFGKASKDKLFVKQISMVYFSGKLGKENVAVKEPLRAIWFVQPSKENTFSWENFRDIFVWETK